jgi:hypothetical protein
MSAALMGDSHVPYAARGKFISPDIECTR